MSLDAFATTLRRLRAAKELTQVDLAAKADVTPSLISRYEQGHRLPPLHILRRLATALGVTPSQLLE